MSPSRWRRAGWAWVAVAGLLLAGLVGAAGAEPARWDWQPGLALTQPWRAWTAALLHWSPQHRWMNAAGAVLLAVLGWRAAMPARDALAWLLAWPLTQWSLGLQPVLEHDAGSSGVLEHYAGLSGVLHAGVALVACRLLFGTQPRSRRRIGLLLIVGLALKLLSEAPWSAATRAVPGWDFALAPLAHVSGALCGLLCFAVCERWHAHRRAPATHA